MHINICAFTRLCIWIIFILKFFYKLYWDYFSNALSNTLYTL